MDNTGTISKNKFKVAGDKKPDYTGTAIVDGIKKEIAAWIRQGEKGEFFSIQFKEPYVKP